MNFAEIPVHLSTGAFGKMPVTDIIALAQKNGFTRIELSSGATYNESMRPAILKAAQSIQFLVHNYFPTPEKEFVVNLASNDAQTLALSRDHAKRAIDLCRDLKAPFYSVHAGFCFHAAPQHLGAKQTDLKRISINEAERIFVESMKELADYASWRGVGLAIENNVLAPFNLLNGKNEMLLGVTAEDLLDLLGAIGKSNVEILLDVGHLHVSANTLGFDEDAFIEAVAKFIRGVHLSDNDGKVDNNQPIREDSWFWQPLKSYLKREVSWVLEAYELSPELMASQLDVAASKISAREILR